MRPDFSRQEAERFASSLYGLDAIATPLASYGDQNFRLGWTDGSRLVLQISNDQDSLAALDLQVQALRHLGRHANGLQVPKVHPALDGTALLMVQ